MILLRERIYLVQMPASGRGSSNSCNGGNPIPKATNLGCDWADDNHCTAKLKNICGQCGPNPTAPPCTGALTGNGCPGNLFTCTEIGGGGCFLARTLVSMADGIKKVIELVVAGDRIISYDTATGRKTEGVVGSVQVLMDDLFKLNNGLVTVSNQHPFYTKKVNGEKVWAVLNRTHTIEDFPSLSYVKELEIGDSILTEDDLWIELISVDRLPDRYRAYNLINVGKEKNYYANGLLVHNEGGDGTGP